LIEKGNFTFIRLLLKFTALCKYFKKLLRILRKITGNQNSETENEHYTCPKAPYCNILDIKYN
jgi:hypothetical protein